uniref:SGTA homodimerisation domain-containing protein n=1 Tax=Bionectria ochroleuca TaxID=29856 RepID=A0A8H7N703_BIOOC
MVDGPLCPPQEPSGPVHLHLQSTVGQPFAFPIKISSSVSFFVANTPPPKQKPPRLSLPLALASAPLAAMAQQSTKQRLALAICDFLNTSATDGTLTGEDKDSIDIAVNCIAESFKVDPAAASTLGGQNLEQIYSVYETLKNKTTTAGAGASSSASSSSSAPEPSDEKKKEADALKSRGNAAMAQKDYKSAIDLYTQALSIHPRNAVFLSNRAAAHSANKDHASARSDADAAVAIDPAYTKAWSRLGSPASPSATPGAPWRPTQRASSTRATAAATP